MHFDEDNRERLFKKFASTFKLMAILFFSIYIMATITDVLHYLEWFKGVDYFLMALLVFVFLIIIMSWLLLKEEGH